MVTEIVSRSLNDCEAIIERGQQTFVEVGQALMEIRERRLYRETHATFGAYCKERWGWSRDYGYKLMRATRAVLDGDVDNCLQTEGAVREARMQILGAQGLTVSPGGQDGSVQAVNALLGVYRPFGRESHPEDLRRTIETLVGAWGPRKEALAGSLIKGLGRLYRRDGRVINDAEMVSHLAHRAGGPNTLIGDARGYQRAVGGSIQDAVSHLFVQEYNKGRRSGNCKLRAWRR